MKNHIKGYRFKVYVDSATYSEFLDITILALNKEDSFTKLAKWFKEGNFFEMFKRIEFIEELTIVK